MRIFEDRADAGRQLAAALGTLKLTDPVVLALPRGGVPVALEVARALHAPLDLLLVRKIGAPWQSELAVGAVAEGESPVVVTDSRTLALSGDGLHYVQEQAKVELNEIERRRALYLHGRERVPLKGREVVLVDDGIATGTTVRAALKAIRRAGPARLVLAVPVGPPDTLEQLSREVDRLVCLHCPQFFRAVGQFYADFRQVDDDEVIQALDAASTPARP
jgi:putative phosphoribosyl transferase